LFLQALKASAFISEVKTKSSKRAKRVEGFFLLSHLQPGSCNNPATPTVDNKGVTR